MKVQVKPSDDVIRTAQAEISVTDAQGRTLTLRKPNVLAHYRLVKILGDAASNTAYMSLVSPITYLTAIDGSPVAQPNTERELDALIQRLDEDGIMALMDGLQKHFAKAPQAEQEQALKNS